MSCFGDLLARFDDKYLCPSCGHKFVLLHTVVSCGHGEYYHLAYLQCDCGLRTVGFCVDSFDGILEFLEFINKYKR